MKKKSKTSVPIAYSKSCIKLEVIPLGKKKSISRLNKNLDEEESTRIQKEKKISKESISRNMKQKEKSLAELTKKFYRKIIRVEDQTLSIDEICNDLNICRRRAYDLTNILEGLGCLQKGETTKFRWRNLSNREKHKIVRMGKSLKEKGQKSPDYYESEINKMNEKIRALYEKNKKHLDFELSDLKHMAEEKVKEDEYN